MPTRRHFLTQLALVPWVPAANGVIALPRIDAHTHVSDDAPYLREVMDALHVKMTSVCDGEASYAPLAAQAQTAAGLAMTRPRYYAWSTTFTIDQMRRRDASHDIADSLRRNFASGALAVNAPPSIGVRAISATGRFLQIDDPLFDPILETVEQENKTLLSHLVDPRLSAFFGRDPSSPAFRDDVQSEIVYQQMVRARDAMMAKHPSLRVIAGHFGFIDLDQVGRRLDRFPNLAIDTSLAVAFLCRQPRDKVREFFLKYQDRIIYASGQRGGPIPTWNLTDKNTHARWTPKELARERADLLDRYEREFAYFETMRTRWGNGTVKGLELPQEVLRKIYYANAARWLPGIERGVA